MGGGPVGLTLAAELGWRDSGALLVEERTAPTAHPKATLLGARSMEYFRRWGICDAVYANALPPEINYHITFCTRLAGRELYRVVQPSIRDTIERPPAALARWRELEWSPYYKTQIGQQALEPILWDFAARQPSVDLRHGWRCESFTQNASGVTAELVAGDGGARQIVRSQYLVACDGGGSAIRKALGIRMNGRGRMRANVSFYFRSREFLDVHGKGLGNLYFVFAHDSFGVFTAIDGREFWNFQYYFLDPARQTEALDPQEILQRAVGRAFKFELVGVQHWYHHQSVARQWRAQRVFLAGDAAHLFVPTGGVGMNTGIGDAVDLGWKLHAVLAGWGGEKLLDSYEAERKPVAVRNSVISANNSDKIDMVMDETPPEIDADTPAGAAARQILSGKIRWMARQFNSAGTHLGYRYVDSPIVVSDGTPEPPDDFMQVVPSTWPGSRAPHVWLGADQSVRGRSTLDWFGRGFVLLVRDSDCVAMTTELTTALRTRAVPYELIVMHNDKLARIYETKLVLVRPDGHVAWRGDRAPPQADAVVATAIGA
jgi:2-polyprenyl-6-methoxyphenol hydroxylase-like FAD-dependent oxidoreductase